MAATAAKWSAALRPSARWLPAVLRPAPPGFPQGPWPQQPPPPPKGNTTKWLLIAIALLLVVGVSIGATLLFTRDGGGPSNPPTTGVPSDIASANDTGPVSIITEEPTCKAFNTINNGLADVRVRRMGWPSRAASDPLPNWTPEQRTQVEAVATAMRNAADQTVPLAKQTPHRVVREIYDQFIAYGRAYADSITDYSPADNGLASANVSASCAIIGICNAIELDLQAVPCRWRRRIRRRVEPCQTILRFPLFMTSSNARAPIGSPPGGIQRGRPPNGRARDAVCRGPSGHPSVRHWNSRSPASTDYAASEFRPRAKSSGNPTFRGFRTDGCAVHPRLRRSADRLHDCRRLACLHGFSFRQPCRGSMPCGGGTDVPMTIPRPTDGYRGQMTTPPAAWPEADEDAHLGRVTELIRRTQSTAGPTRCVAQRTDEAIRRKHMVWGSVVRRTN